MKSFTAEEIEQKLQELAGEDWKVSIDEHKVFNLQLPVNELYRFILSLFRDRDLGFNFLTDICGVHYPNLPGQELAVVYHIQSMIQHCRLRLKVFTSSDQPEIPSITGVFASANWMERETYDFFGIKFLGHPNLTRILNMDEMIDFPMRKEFPLEDPLREDKMDFHFGR